MNGLISELADRLVSEGIIDEKYEDEPFETRLMKLCENCPENLPNLYRKELHRPGIFGLLCNPKLLDLV